MFAIAPLLPGFHEVFHVVTVAGTPGPLVAPSPRRAIIYIANSASADLFMWMTRSTFDPAVPQIIVPNDTILRFTWSMDGPMSTFGWSAAYRLGSNDVAVTEILWLPDQLAQSLAGA